MTKPDKRLAIRAQAHTYSGDVLVQCRGKGVNQLNKPLAVGGYALNFKESKVSIRYKMIDFPIFLKYNNIKRKSVNDNESVPGISKIFLKMPYLHLK